MFWNVKQLLIQTVISKFPIACAFKKYLQNLFLIFFYSIKSSPSGTLNHIHIWSNNWNLHQVSGKPKPKMSNGLKFERQSTKAVLSRLWTVHLFVM